MSAAQRARQWLRRRRWFMRVWRARLTVLRVGRTFVRRASTTGGAALGFARRFVPGASGMTWRVHRSVMRRLDRDFDAIVEHSTLSRSRPLRNRAGRRVRATILIRSMPPVSGAVEQAARLRATDRWNPSTMRRIGAARFATMSRSDLDAIDPARLISVLISGRPVALCADAAGSGVGDIVAAEANMMTESELALSALRQLRSLLGLTASSNESIGSRVPKISVVLSTNRPQLLESALRQVQAQQGVDVELLVGIHATEAGAADGFDLDLVGGAVSSGTVTMFPADVVFGDVLEQLSRAASAPYLSKWDDDDLYGPSHLLDLWAMAVLSRSALVGKAAEFVLLEQSRLLIRRRGSNPYRPSRFLAGGAILMSREALAGVGGWGRLSRGVDQDIIGRFGSNGLRTFRIHGYEFVLVRHGHGHTWSADDQYFLGAADGVWAMAAIDERTGVAPVTTVPVSVEPVCEPVISVCVPNRDNPASVRLFEHQTVRFRGAPQLVVCDDRSIPPLRSEGQSATTVIVPAPPGQGFGAGRARQRAAESGAGDVIMFADADIYIADDAFSTITDRLRAGFCGAMSCDLEFSSVDTVTALASLDELGVGAMHDLLEANRIEGQHWREAHWARSADLRHPRSSSYRATVGAFLVVDRPTFDRTGGFRDVVVRGVEDIEFGYRLLASGCDQEVHRGGGIWHLGERTFAGSLTADEDELRERHLSALVPIWSRTLSERAGTLTKWTDDVVPFVGLPVDHPGDMVSELAARLGRGAVAAGPEWPTLLSAPFALVTTMKPSPRPAEAFAAAFAAFRHTPHGEVIVFDDGREVLRLVALWAVNRVRTGLGLPLDGPISGELVTEQVADDLRRRIGSAVVEC